MALLPSNMLFIIRFISFKPFVELCHHCRDCSKHRISNNNNISLELIEVQCGESVEESDIIRFEDKYGRLNT